MHSVSASKILIEMKTTMCNKLFFYRDSFGKLSKAFNFSFSNSIFYIVFFFCLRFFSVSYVYICTINTFSSNKTILHFLITKNFLISKFSNLLMYIEIDPHKMYFSIDNGHSHELKTNRNSMEMNWQEYVRSILVLFAWL